ncbi:MAG: hypothetical protein CENE_03796 [Candidatus Celerinatantimonas neptuna]|nr:MAG: hypothetical protein CENE_03796 [Candidatus Celerinatantimonas neptuna]
MIFSASTCGFYPECLKKNYDVANTWPSDAIVIDNDVFLKFSAAPPSGKKRGADENGMPCWIDLPEQTVKQKQATKAAMVRSERDSIVDRVSREINRLEDAGTDASSWRKYRMALRNVPEQDGFPSSITWPTQPAKFTGK